MKFIQIIKNSLERAVKKIGGEVAIDLEHPREECHGDYACNVAMKLSRQLNQSSLKIAEQIVTDLGNDEQIMTVVEKIGIAKPGFINFTLKPVTLLDEVRQILKHKDNYGKVDLGQGQKALIEYSQMNVAKPMHVGHLRTVILGDSLKRLYDYLGYKTVSDTHYGDWGTQFGMVLLAYKRQGDEKKLQQDPVGELVRLYVDMSAKAKEDENVHEAAKAEFKKLEDGDKQNKKLWKFFVKESIKGFEKLYEELDILPFEYNLGESYYEKMMKEDIKSIEKSGIAVIEEKLMYVDLDKYNLGRCILVKSDGATTYHLRDISTYRNRMEDIKVDKNLYVVDSRQSHHFKQLFKVIELLGWPGITRTEHISYGFVSLPEGSLSTRSGRIIAAKDVLEQGKEKARQMIKEKNPSLKNREQVAQKVMRAAIKFANLSANRNTDIIFDWDNVLSFEGDTGPYLMYTYARIQSIMRKVGKLSVKFDSADLNPSELFLVRHIYRFSESLILSHEQNDPHFIAEFLLEMAHKFNTFYENTPISSAEDHIKKQRLAISSAVAQVLKKGLELLGIEVVEEM